MDPQVNRGVVLDIIFSTEPAELRRMMKNMPLAEQNAFALELARIEAADASASASSTKASASAPSTKASASAPSTKASASASSTKASASASSTKASASAPERKKVADAMQIALNAEIEIAPNASVKAALVAASEDPDAFVSLGADVDLIRATLKSLADTHRNADAQALQRALEENKQMKDLLGEAKRQLAEANQPANLANLLDRIEALTHQLCELRAFIQDRDD